MTAFAVSTSSTRSSSAVNASSASGSSTMARAYGIQSTQPRRFTYTPYGYLVRSKGGSNLTICPSQRDAGGTNSSVAAMRVSVRLARLRR